MLLKKMGKKLAITSISFSLIASPLAMAQSSIELNQDRSAGQDVIDKPKTHKKSNAVHVSAGNLNRDEGDSLDFSPSSSAPVATEEKPSRESGYNPGELNRDEGDSTDW